MARLTWARLEVAIVVAGLLVLVRCASGDPPGSHASYCEQVASPMSRCTSSSVCDSAFTNGCDTIEKALSPASMTATRDCLQSGLCSVTGCLVRALPSAKPTAAHLALATDYCQRCAPELTDCEAQFYAKKGKLPGVLVLPYSEAVARAVDVACATNAGDCRPRFTSCALDTIDRTVKGAIDPALASCVIKSFRGDVPEATTPSGGPEVVTCTPANCNGCCRDDKCLTGDTDDACGAVAAACATCSGAQRCAEGRCKDPCGPDTCAGCCNGDICVAGTDTATCGRSGAACSSCAKQGASFVCSNGQCIDGSCKATCTTGCCSATGCQPGTAKDACGAKGDACIDCGVGRTCSAGHACALDPTSLWDLHITSAVIPDRRLDGSAWDVLNGLPDPYVVVDSVSHSGQTQVKNDTTNPVWSETPLLGLRASELLQKVSIAVWDSDVEFDDYIGGCDLPVTEASFDGALEEVTCPATTTSVELKLSYSVSPHR